MKHLSWIKGLIFGALFSFITALLFMLIGQVWAGGITSFWGEEWLYFSVIIPFAITFAVLGGYFHNRNVLSNKKTLADKPYKCISRNLIQRNSWCDFLAKLSLGADWKR